MEHSGLQGSRPQNMVYGAWIEDIDKWCRDNRMGTQDFARQINVNPSTVRRWRNGMRIQTDNVDAIHRVTNIPVERIVELRDPMTDAQTSNRRDGSLPDNTGLEAFESPSEGSEILFDTQVQAIGDAALDVDQVEDLDDEVEPAAIPFVFKNSSIFDRAPAITKTMGCQFPVFDGSAGAMRDSRYLCGEPRVSRPGKPCPYCLTHAKIAYINFQV
jgi:hypothetical protein